MSHYSRLEQTTAAFNEMIQRFGVVTVMDVKVYNSSDIAEQAGLEDGVLRNVSVCEVLDAAEAVTPICTLDTLKVANISQEGPTKTVTGGQNASPLLKFGKTARLEMQDALGNAEALEALCGTITEYLGASGQELPSPVSTDFTRFAVHAGDEFGGPKTLIGNSFFINQKNGAQVPVTIVVYQFLPDSVFNLTQDAEGDATVFDLNGDLIATKIILGDKSGNGIVKNLFYSIVDPQRAEHTDEPSVQG